MKLIPLHQIVTPNHSGPSWVTTTLWVNRDIIRWAHEIENDTGTLRYTKLTLIADDKPLEVLETPAEINKLCNFVQEIRVTKNGPRLVKK